MAMRDVARVQPGYLSRTSVHSVSTGTHRLLQARDISPQHGVRLDAVVRFMPERNPDLYRVSRGDILLTARGQDHRACLVDVDLPDVLASSVFYIQDGRRTAERSARNGRPTPEAITRQGAMR